MPKLTSPLNCKACKQPLPSEKGSMVMWWIDMDDDNHIVDFFWCCKFECDVAVKRQQPQRVVDNWSDLLRFEDDAYFAEFQQDKTAQRFEPAAKAAYDQFIASWT